MIEGKTVLGGSDGKPDQPGRSTCQIVLSTIDDVDRIVTLLRELRAPS